jgi:hypothetical protein
MATPSHLNQFNTRAGWPEISLTIMIGGLAAYLAWPQIFSTTEADNEMTLAKLNKRAAILRQISDPVQRDSACIGLSAYGRQLDQHIPNGAHVFFSGIVGKENGGRLAWYYFLRNYLFPRELEISVDRKAVFNIDGFTGVDTASVDELRTNGFDLWLKMGSDNNISFQPITEKGTPR